MDTGVKGFGRGKRANGPAGDAGRTAGAKRRSRGGAEAASEIVVLDGDGRIVAVNDAWRKSLAAHVFVAPDAGVGALYTDLACWFLPDLDRAVVERALQQLRSGEVEVVRHTFAIPAGDRECWRQVQITPLSIGGPGRFVAIHDDQTELATAREALAATCEELLSARDEERQRIALELHDSTCQQLVAIGLNLARLRRAAPADGSAAEIIGEIEASLSEVVKETRVLSYLMKPRDLGPKGLSASTLQFLEGFARRTGLEVTLESDGAIDRVTARLQHAALRIVQEALLNAHRHAQARRVTVELKVDDGLLRVQVADDGHGMDCDEGGEARPGVGIPGMRARAQQFSGSLAISSDETGTRVTALLPLRNAP